jgi:hypothetical protein
MDGLGVLCTLAGSRVLANSSTHSYIDHHNPGFDGHEQKVLTLRTKSSRDHIRSILRKFPKLISRTGVPPGMLAAEFDHLRVIGFQ